jgi:hypothetical protein
MSKKTEKLLHHRTFGEFTKFAEEFKNESDRAAVIVGTAQLDLLLFQLLDSTLLPVASGKDELLEGDSPLATFSSRINICFRLGLIEAEFARALHLVRRIRNSFAHEVSNSTLDTGSHRDRVRELTVPFASNWALRKILEDFFDDSSSSGAKFRACIALMSLRLDGAIQRSNRFSTSDTVTLLPPDQKITDQLEDSTTYNTSAVKESL